MLSLFDPPREDAKATVATARGMGIKIKMVTGDALAIARETAKTLDMGSNILDGASLGDAKKNEAPEVAASIEGADGFAQVFPEHKFHIVDVLQTHGHIVGMTGDGVNDAPALKKADCGIAVSGATDAARAAASIVLMTAGLSVIIDAVKESRCIFQRMNSYAIYRIAETLRVLFFMTLAILVFNFYPLTAVMIVMLALLNDGAILSTAYDNVHYRDAPEAWNMRLVLGISTVLGVLGVIAAFGRFYLGERVFHLDRPHIQTLMYLKLSVAGHLTIFLTRTRGPFWSIRPATILWAAVLGTQAVATYVAIFGFGLVTPLAWYWALLVWGYALAWFLVNDRVKLLACRLLDHAKAGTKPAVAAEPRQDAGAMPKAQIEASPVSVANVLPKSEREARPEPAADAGAGSGSKAAEGADAHAKPAPGTVAKHGADAEPAPAVDHKPEAGLAAQPGAANANVAALVDTKLGDVLLAAVLKDPASAGRFVAQAIAKAEAPASVEEPPEAKAVAATAPVSAPKAAE